MDNPISLRDITQAVENERTKKAKRKAEEDAKVAILVDEFLPVLREKVVAKIAAELEQDDGFPKSEVSIPIVLPDKCFSPEIVKIAAEEKIARILGDELAALGSGIITGARNNVVRVRIPSKIIT